MEHDRRFKQLLTTFFIEFLDLLLKDVSRFIDRKSIVFLEKEIFTDIASSDRHEVDLLVRARFLGGGEAFFVILVENQLTSRKEFARRMFKYFARLYEKYGLPVYPVAIFSYDRPFRPEPNRHRVEFPGLRVLDFTFRTIQLNRLNWRDFVRTPNPVASALMAKMKIAPKDRPRVKLECLRMLATLKLDKARSALIGSFMDRYLKLTAAEEAVYNQELMSIDRGERKVVMELTNTWIERGRLAGRVEGFAKGRAKGGRELLLRLLESKLGTVPKDIKGRINRLADANVEELGEALFGFNKIADVKNWLDHRR